MPEQLRYFFELGVPHTPLWPFAMDSPYGYPTDLHRLPVGPATRAELVRLCERYQTSVDWSDPAGPSPWTEEEHEVFRREARAAFEALRGELGEDFTVVDESLL
ncbi:hypothetical protein ABZX38_30880 [Streptomyces longwoodensis]|uniref:hypothetical protein n=1 Tax=Streptomyces longwoodensis TaxID=68231 RepID=UPI0033BB8AD4